MLIKIIHKFSDEFDDDQYNVDDRTEVPHLTLGKRYSATLVDLEEEDTIASFVFTASNILILHFSNISLKPKSLILGENDPKTVFKPFPMMKIIRV